MKPLYPIMAVLAIASVGATPLRTLAADGDQQAPAPKADPRDALAQILTDASNRADAGKRIEEFLLTPPTGGYLNEDVDDAAKAALGKVANEWGATKGKVTDVAALYFIIGPGANAPTWATAGKNFASLSKHAAWEAQVRGALLEKGWKGKIHKVNGSPSTSAFLDEAVTAARTIFDHPETRAEIDASIGKNDDPPPVLNTGRTAGPRLDGATSDYTLDDIYKTGAKWGDVSGPKDENSRTLSMKIYTKRLPNGETVNEIGVFDITDSADIFGRRFPVGGSNQAFVLDDRTPGHKKYELNFKTLPNGDREITLQRPDGGQVLTTKVSELYMERANQAGTSGNVVKVGNEEFYVVPQGGAKGAVAMFPKALIDARADVKDPRNLEPALYAEIGKRGPDGRTQNLGGKPMLGKVGDKDYHLEFNKALGLWEVVEGAGDPPEPPKPPTGGGNPGGGNPGGGNPGGGNPGGGTDENGGRSIADLKLMLPDCPENADDIKDLRSDLKGKYSIVRCIGGPVILVPRTQYIKNQQLDFQTVRRARFLDHYLVLQFDTAVQYQDLLRQNTSGYILAGYVDTEAKNAGQFDDIIPFMDALKNYMDVPKDDRDKDVFNKVQARVNAHKVDNKYRLTAGYVLENGKKEFRVNLQTGGRSNMIWPKNDWTPGKPDETPKPYAALNGAANAMDGVSSVDAALPVEIPIEESRVAKLMSGKKDDIALYEVDTDPKKYYVMFRFATMDKADPNKPEMVKKVMRSKHFEAFGANNPLPKNYEIQGLANDDPKRPASIILDRVVAAQRFVPGTNAEKGVIAVYQRKTLEGPNQQNVADNCVGPIIWWGVSPAEALTACQKDKM